MKNPKATQHGQIHFHDIGDYLSQKEKLEKISTFKSIEGISAGSGWQTITPDEHGDWLKQRDDSFADYIVLGDKKGDAPKLFENFSLGVVTNRDAWCYNSSKTAVSTNVGRMIGFYNQEADRLSKAHPGLDKKQRDTLVDDFIDTDSTRIAWTRALKQDLARDRRLDFDTTCLVPSLYRPFTKQWLYFNRRLNEMVYQMPRFFPNAEAQNIVIGVSASDSRSAYSVFISDHITSLHAVDMVGSQYFPLYLYDEPVDEVASSIPEQHALFGGSDNQNDATAAPGTHQRRDAITAEGLAYFQTAYPAEDICREDIFYYVYGLLHSPEYRERFADNLGKELPRIPCVKTAEGFWAFSKAGRALAEMHIGYEAVSPYPAKVCGGSTAEDYRVDNMKYGKGKDKTTLHYNAKITVTGIPLEAYEYVVNGKAALDWVVERQRVKPDKVSGIVNDANDWAIDTMSNPRYPLELFLRVVTVSLETMKIVKSLPPLDI